VDVSAGNNLNTSKEQPREPCEAREPKEAAVAKVRFGGMMNVRSATRMNVFERVAKDEVMKASGIVTAWTCFVAAVDELIASYNGIPKGMRHPARVKQRSDAGIVVECALGLASDDPFSQLMLTITANRQRASIDACIEKWELRMPGVPRKSNSRQSFSLALEVDSESDRTWLTCEGETYDPYSAAEMLLKRALLDQ
jgi:hypothetical protein